MWGSVSNVFEWPPDMPATSRNSVSMGAGQSASTLIRRAFSSSRSARDRLATNDFVAPYTAMRGVGTNEAIELTLMITPPCRI